ncbi:MAG: hypothetical protein QM500_13740 [Methylococcales bacterium]
MLIIKRNMNVMFKIVLKYSIIFLLIIYLDGCSNCTNVTTKSIQNGDWIADLDYRVCGYVSGYSVAIYHSNDGPLGSGEGDKEVFQAKIRDKEIYSPQKKPISIEWTGDKNLLIRHDTRMSVDDSNLKLMVLKAESKYKGISISYDPKPVIWE